MRQAVRSSNYLPEDTVRSWSWEGCGHFNTGDGSQTIFIKLITRSGKRIQKSRVPNLTQQSAHTHNVTTMLLQCVYVQTYTQCSNNVLIATVQNALCVRWDFVETILKWRDYSFGAAGLGAWEIAQWCDVTLKKQNWCIVCRNGTTGKAIWHISAFRIGPSVNHSNNSRQTSWFTTGASPSHCRCWAGSWTFSRRGSSSGWCWSCHPSAPTIYSSSPTTRALWLMRGEVY